MSEPPSLVSVIVELGLSSRAELEEALARQLIYGGDLIDNLLELGLVDEAGATRALARFHRLPEGAPAPFAIDDHSTRVALDHGERVLVRRVDLDRVVAITRAPLSETSLETLGLALEAHVEQELGLAARIEEALSSLTQEPLPRRAELLLQELGPRPPRLVRPPTPSEFRPPSQLFSPLPLRPEAPPSSELVATMSFTPQGEPRGGQPHEGITAPPPAGYETITRASERPGGEIEPLLAHAKIQLERASDRDFVLDELLDTVGQLFEYVALFALSATEARGLRASGAGLTGPELSALRIPFDLASPFERVARTKTERVVRLRASGLEGGIAQDLRRPTGSRVLLFPLTVRDKAVLLLWADSGVLDVPKEGAALVRELAPHVSSALGRALVERKRASRIPMAASDVGALLPSFGGPATAPRAEPPTRADEPSPSVLLDAPGFEPNQDLTRRDTTPRRPKLSLPSEFGGQKTSPAELPANETVEPSAHTAAAPLADETTAPPIGAPALEARAETPLPTEAGEHVGRQRPRVDTARLTVAPEARQQAPLKTGEPTPDAPEPPAELLSDKPGSHEVAPNARRKFDDDPEFPSDAPRTWKGFPGSPPPPGVTPLPPPPSIAAPAPAPVPSDLRLTPRRIVAVGASKIPPAPSEPPRPAQPAKTPDPPAVEPAPAARRDGIAVVSSFADPQRADALEARAPLLEAPPPLVASTPEIRPGGTLVSRRPLLHEPPEDGWGAPAVPFGKRSTHSRAYDELVEAWLGGDELALDRLLEGGDSAVASLIARFPGPIQEPESPQTPASACGPLLLALVRLGAQSTPFLTVRTADENPAVRRWATLVLGELPGRESAKAIAGRLLDSSADVRRAALSSARRLQGDTLARRTLRSQIEEMAVDARLELDARIAAIEALADIREHEAIPTLLQILSDKDRSVARSAQWALTVLTRQDFGSDFAAWRDFWQSHRDEPRIEWLIAALDHERMDLRRAAGDEIRSMAGTDFGFHEALHEDERREIQELVRGWWRTTQEG